MKICIFGAGAIGGYVGAELARAGNDVSLVVRGPHLAAIQERGLRLEINNHTHTVRLPATDEPSSLGPQDVVFLTLKAHSISAAVPDIQSLLGPHTSVVNAVNGIPWWYFHGLDSPYANHLVESVDPGGVIYHGIGVDRAIGCVVYPSAEIVEPGVIRHLSGNKLCLGEPTGEKTARVTGLARVLIEAGFKAPVRPRLRDEIWVKLWGNLAFNPLSALTHATLDTLASDPGTRAIAKAMMREGQAIGEQLGVRFRVDIEKRIDAAGAVGAHRTSMLQDLELGRPLEVGALIESVQEMGRLVGVDTPNIDMVHALLVRRIRSRDDQTD